MVNALHFFIISICFGISPISFWELAKQGREGHLLGSWGNNGDSKFIWKTNHYTLCIAEYQILSNTQQMIKTLSPCSEVQNLRILLLCFHGAFYWKISLSSRNYYVLISNTFARLTVTRSRDVLVLARIEFIFFPAAAMVLCFGFRITLITHQCFSCCRARLSQSQGHFIFWCCPAHKVVEGAQEAGKEKSQDSWPQLAKGIFHTI